MKHLKHLLKYKFLIIIFVFAFTNLVSAQTVSTTDQAFTGPDFGSTILVPINTSDIHSIYGNILIATITVEYDENILTYTGYTNMNATIAAQNLWVQPAGGDGIVQFNIEGFGFTPFQWPDGKAWDIQFTYNGGYSALDITLAEFLNWEFTTYNATVTNGSVDGFVDISATDGDWHTTSIWSPPADMGSLTAPGPGHNVSINPGGTVTISADAICNDLTVGASSNGQLTLNSGTLEVLGDFLIESVATGTGSFIQNGTLSVTGGTTGAERYIAAAPWGVNLNGWHFLSSPVANQAISGSFTPSGGAGDYDFYRWNETSYTWENQKIHNFTPFFVGKGYLVAYEQAGTKTFSGAFNTADVIWSNLTRLTTGDTTGWNLIGNPYPCAIIWGAWSLTNIAANAKVWNEVSSAYIDINPGGIIPAMNGLMVHVTDVTGGSLTIPAADRTHSATGWYKSNDQRILLVAHDLDYGELAQQSVVRFNEASTVGYDSEFDSHFLQGYAPVFYSVAEGKYLSTNTLPEWSTELVVPFMFEKNGSSNFNIELAETIEGYDVFLKDLKENITVNLTEITNYAFTSEEGDDPARFEILFGVVGIDDIDALSAARIYSFNNKIIIANVTGATNMDIFNIQGQMVDNFSFNSTGFEEIAVDLPSGIYMVRLSNSGEIKTSKVFVK